MADHARPVDEGGAPFDYNYTSNLVDLLATAGVTLVITTYQAGKLVVVRVQGNRLSALLRSFEFPMGVAVNGRQLAVGTRDRIWLFRNAPDIGRQMEPPGRYDACYLPRTCHVTGDVRIHELSWAGEELWFVNTRFSCLSTIHPDFSFCPRWRPPFVNDLKAEDRCHLNGLEIVDGKPRFVTALGETDVAEGWRENKASGGCLIDVPSGEMVARALCMPHSPRVRDDQLWVLESGTGRLLTIAGEGGKPECLAELPGFARGLDFYGRHAFIGLSKIRESSAFAGLPNTDRRNQLKCGVAVVDTHTGAVASLLEFTRGVEEIFDVRVLPNVRFPAVVGFEKDTIQNVFVVPEEM